MRLYKKYVNMLTIIDKERHVKPVALLWEAPEGIRTIKIDKIYEVRKAASVVGGCGLLFRCRLDHKDRNFFFERDRWFIESHKP